MTRRDMSAVVWGSSGSGSEESGRGLRFHVLNWKKQRNRWQTVEPPPVDNWAQFIHDRGGNKIDVWTIPPPSFHQVDSYPALILAQRMADLCNRKIVVLWPDRYEKKRKVWMANIEKKYPPPCEDVKGKTVLVLDDIATTGNTMAATMESLIIAGAYPAGCVYA